MCGLDYKKIYNFVYKIFYKCLIFCPISEMQIQIINYNWSIMNNSYTVEMM